MSGDTKRVVIVGGSAAGLSVAEMLRRRGFAGEVIVIEQAREAGYERPPLSKQVLRGEVPPGGGQYERTRRLGVDLRYGLGAVELSVAGHAVSLSNGTTLPYDDIVIATGVTPRRLVGSELDGVHVLRTHEDATGLRINLASSTSMVVIGAGFLGLEVAASARGLGRDVTVVDVIENPLFDRLGVAAASQLRERHLREGVQLRTAGVASFLPDGTGTRVSRVALSDGTALVSDCVLMAIGSRPSVDWLVGSGLDISDGVVCDEWCCAAPGVWAAGDVARWRHPAIGETVRIEHRTNATEQAAVVASNILGERVTFAPVPYFWTDQYDIRIQVAGFIPSGNVGVRTDVTGSSADAFVDVFHADDGRIVGVLAWNAAKALGSLRRQIDLGPPKTPMVRVGRENGAAPYGHPQ